MEENKDINVLIENSCLFNVIAEEYNNLEDSSNYNCDCYSCQCDGGCDCVCQSNCCDAGSCYDG